ncbi:MAG: SPOR domain-containing protein [Intestinibacter sp.]|uniref:SPOR domain-containing protein n=1 Tax=Intestinibacter sp. TaxID=1965304 RepID=UPI003F18C016
MSNKKIYKGLNKRRKFHFRKFITTVLCMALIIGYAYKKIEVDGVLKNFNLSKKISFVVDKACFWKNLDLQAFKLNSTDAKKSDKLLEQSEKETESKNSSSNSKVAIVEGIDVYLIQVGSFDNEADLNKIEAKLEQNKMPNSTLKIDGVNKSQTYISFKEEDMRQKLPTVKNLFNDAFVTKLEIPVLSLEYTDEYSYIKNISDYMNSLLKSYEEEANYLNENKSNFDIEKYQTMMNERKEILNKLDNEVKKIDYKELDYFKNNLLSYTSQIKDNISNSEKIISSHNLYKYESFLISSIQMYYEFINQIKTA